MNPGNRQSALCVFCGRVIPWSELPRRYRKQGRVRGQGPMVKRAICRMCYRKRYGDVPYKEGLT